MFFVILFLIIGNSDYPDWFYNPPDNSIAVIVDDQYSFESRFINLYLRANSVLQMRKNRVLSVGYEAYRESNERFNRSDKFKVEFDFNESDKLDVIDKFGYQLTKTKRLRGDVVFGLFEKVSSSQPKEVSSSNKWISDKSDKFTAVGFSSGSNYLKTSNWKEAFEHALFQLTMNNNVMVLSDIDQKKYENGSLLIDRKTNEQVNIVKHNFKGIYVSNRYYDKKENTYYLKLKTRR